MDSDSFEIFRRYNQATYGLDNVFTNIAIETTSFCNRGCDFCPVGHERRPVKQMSLLMYEDILQQLATLKYVGHISLHWFNEPLADKRIVTWIALARQACPESHIYFASNGDLLNRNLFDCLVRAGLDLIRVSQYDGHVRHGIQEILDDGLHLSHLHVQVKQAEDLQSARAGALPHLQVLQAPLPVRCIRPDEQLVIAATGEVPLCANDYFISQRIGNVEQTSLLDLWNHPQLRLAREALRRADRTQFPICRACNEPDAPYGKFLPRGRRAASR